MPLSNLERKNIEHTIGEYEKDRKVLNHYSSQGFYSLEEVMEYLERQIIELEEELEQ